MCDCYSTMCEYCDNKIEMHISDYCTGRENVKVVCNECIESGRAYFEDGKWEVQEIQREDQVWVEYDGEHFDVGVIGQNVAIHCDDNQAYGISLN